MDDARIDQVLAPILQFGAERYGEAITQYAHAVQCAYLAQLEQCGPELIAAALLHDVGQFIDDAGHAAEQNGTDGRHEDTGAAFLGHYFGANVTEPVRLHVAAKRYLCAVDPDYRASLSAASELSLQLQGGPMSPSEAEEFVRGAYFAEALRLRRIDDAGKVRDRPVPSLETYRPLLASVLLPMPA